MKKFIQISSVLSLLLVFAAVSAFAQTTKKYQADIPFDFNVGQNTYKSGNYIIKLSRLTANGLTLTLEDADGKPLENIFVTNTGLVAKGNPQLVFNRYGSQRFLSQVLSQDLGVSIRTTKTEKIAAEKSRSKDVVSFLIK